MNLKLSFGNNKNNSFCASSGLGIIEELLTQIYWHGDIEGAEEEIEWQENKSYNCIK